MPTDMRKVVAGAALLVISSVVILGSGQAGSGLPPMLASVASIGLAAGALLVGTSEGVRPV